MSVALTVLEADLHDPEHAAAIVEGIAAYAADPMGGGHELPEQVREGLVPALRDTPGARVWLARDGDEYVGLVTVFVGLSTFAARPRWNIHDAAVLPHARGRGVGRAMLEAVLAAAKASGACAVSLEVRHDNAPARHLYASLGFSDAFAPMAFWTREL